MLLQLRQAPVLVIAIISPLQMASPAMLNDSAQQAEDNVADLKDPAHTVTPLLGSDGVVWWA